MHRFLIADDHPMMRQAIVQIILDDWPEALCEEVADGDGLLLRGEEQPWHLVITDISMPGKNGLEAMETIRRKVPHLPVLIVSIHSENRYALKALRSGASGFIPKPRIQQELVKAI